MLRHAVLCYATPGFAMPCFPTQCFTSVLRHVVFRQFYTAQCFTTVVRQFRTAVLRRWLCRLL